jgi:N-acetylglucosamine kinase-like BadF-type ATPase
MTRYVLGIDGGATKTLAVILAEDGRVRGSGLSGSSSYDNIGIDAARDSLHAAVQAARQSAGLSSVPFAAAFLGLAGVTSRQDRTIVEGMAADLRLADIIGVDHDCRVALAGGLSARAGIVLIAGTGSSCFGMNAQGERWQAGGWGHWISDEGSSYWLGLNALRLAMGAYDGRWSTTLLDPIQARLGLQDMSEILHRLHVEGLSKTEIAALAPLVIETSQAGDALAQELIQQGAEALALCVQAVARRLGWADAPCELALVGGLFQSGEAVLGPLRTTLEQHLPLCRPVMAELPPVVGAGLLALQSLGISTEGELLSRLRVDLGNSSIAVKICIRNLSGIRRQAEFSTIASEEV